MGAQLLDGKVLAAQLKDSLKAEVAELKKATGIAPTLINVMIGNNASSCTYAKSQQKAAEYMGINYKLVNLEPDITQKSLNDYILQLNQDYGINGIMIHKPVPPHIDYGEVANLVDTAKDLEGINVANIGKMILSQTKILPCTPAAVMEHIKSTNLNFRGKEAVVVGHSQIVGKPLTLLLLAEFMTVTVCHIATSEAGRLEEHVGRADVLVVAVGQAGLIKGDWVKPGALVVDVGINQVDGQIVGDVEFDKAQEKAAYITPVPGGVGPVTVVMLMRNGVEAFKAQIKGGVKV